MAKVKTQRLPKVRSHSSVLEYDSENSEKISLTPRQIEEIDDLEFHFSKGNEKRIRFNQRSLDSDDEADYESDFFDLEEEIVVNPHQEPKTLLARLVSSQIEAKFSF